MWVTGHVGFTLAAGVVTEAYFSKNKSSRQVTFDYRLVAISSLLPDIDKPIGLLLLGTFDRSYLHTLLAGIILLVVGLYLSRSRGSSWMLQIAFCWAIHMILDQVWKNPHLVLWPLSGGAPNQGHATIPRVFGHMAYALTTNPYDYVPEMIGAVLIVLFAIQTCRRGARVFIRTGRIPHDSRG